MNIYLLYIDPDDSKFFVVFEKCLKFFLDFFLPFFDVFGICVPLWGVEDDGFLGVS
jgi:TRAP-type mannitol/chloroaromatic compound transport system permease large subunit